MSIILSARLGFREGVLEKKIQKCEELKCVIQAGASVLPVNPVNPVCNV